MPGQVPLIDHALRGALVERVAKALQLGDRHRVRLAGTDVERRAVLAWYVGIDDAQMRVEAAIDDRARGPTRRAERQHEYSRAECTKRGR